MFDLDRHGVTFFDDGEVIDAADIVAIGDVEDVDNQADVAVVGGEELAGLGDGLPRPFDVPARG